MSGVFEPFDYDAMAEESERRLKALKAGLEKARASPVRGMQELQARNARIMLLEEEIHEESIDLKFFRQRAKERSSL